MSILDDIEKILNSTDNKKKRKLKVKEKWMVEEVYPLFKHRFPDLKREVELDAFLEWAKKKNFSKKELQIIKMAKETKLPHHYKTVWTGEDLNELAEWLGTIDMVAIDTEATGVDKYVDEIVGISFYAPHRGYYIPLKHVDDISTNLDAYQEFLDGGGEHCQKVGVDYVKCLPLELVANTLKPLLSREDLKQIYHNFGYDYHIIRRFLGVNVKCYFDTIIGQAMLDENHPKALKVMATTYLKIPSDTFSDLFGNVTFDRVPVLIDELTGTGNMATFYATKDTELTYKMYEFQIKHLNAEPLRKIRDLYFNIEIPFIHMVVESEERGVRLDTDYLLKEVKPVLEKELNEMREQIVTYIGDINLNSPIQLSKALYSDLKLPQVNKKKPRSTDKATMTKLKPYHEVIGIIMEYRKKAKLMDTFVEKLPDKVINERVHTSFSTIKKTGRMSSSGPNLQQIPSYTNLIRNAFVADEGRLLASLDFSGQELRILSHISGDEVMHNIFVNGGDAHATTAVTIWNNKHPDSPTDIDYFQRLRKVSEAFRDKDGVIVEERFLEKEYLEELLSKGIITTRDAGILVEETELGLEFEKVRGSAKTVNFAIVYGTTSMGLSDTLEISEEEAQMYIDSYMETYPGVAKWIKSTQQQVNKIAYVETMLGRKRRLYPEVNSGKRWLLESAHRMATNFCIQGSAAEMTKKAALDLRPLLKKYDCNILLYVHDELIFDIPENLGMEPLKEFAEIMCSAIPLKCGMKSDIEVSKRWGQKMSEDDLSEFFEEEG